MHIKILRNKVIYNLLNGVIPERKKETTILLKKYEPCFLLFPDRSGGRMEAKGKYVQFDNKTIEALWLIGFSGWKSLETYSPLVILSVKYCCSVEEIISKDKNLEGFERSYKERIDGALSIMKSADIADRYWAEDMPRPVSDRDMLSCNEGKTSFDLVVIAVAYFLLHELKHVVISSDKSSSLDPREEEILCDVFAREYITGKIGMYAKKTGLKYNDILRKRSMGIALGALMLYAITPEIGRQGNAEYPQIGHRVKALTSNVSLYNDSDFWLFMASILIGVFRQLHMQIDIVPTSYRGLTESLIELLIYPED